MAKDKDELRCRKCKKLLGLSDLQSFCVEIKCPRCKQVNDSHFYSDSQIILTDKEGKILYVNDKLEEVTGFMAKEVIGKTPAMWGRQMPRKYYKEMWKKILSTTSVVTFTLTNKKKNGELYKAMIKISPLMDAKNQVQGFLSIETVLN